MAVKEEKSSKSPAVTPSSFSPVLTHELNKAENKRGESNVSSDRRTKQVERYESGVTSVLLRFLSEQM